MIECFCTGECKKSGICPNLVDKPFRHLSISIRPKISIPLTLPADLTKEEAKRIARIIDSYGK